MLEQKNTLTNKNTYLEINSDTKNILICLWRVPSCGFKWDYSIPIGKHLTTPRSVCVHTKKTNFTIAKTGIQYNYCIC